MLHDCYAFVTPSWAMGIMAGGRARLVAPFAPDLAETRLSRVRTA